MRKIDWPYQCPDLNTIELQWQDLKTAQNIYQPGQKLPHEIAQNVLLTHPSRLLAVIQHLFISTVHNTTGSDSAL